MFLLEEATLKLRDNRQTGLIAVPPTIVTDDYFGIMLIHSPNH